MRKGHMTRPTSSKTRRAVFAAVVAATTLVTFGAFGGVGLARTAIGVAQYEYGGQTKVTLCHKDKNTITVGAPAVPAHMRHGDDTGTCAAVKAKAKAEKKAAKAAAAKAKAEKAAAKKAAKEKAKAEKAAAKAAAAKAKAEKAAAKAG